MSNVIFQVSGIGFVGITSDLKTAPSRSRLGNTLILPSRDPKGAVFRRSNALRYLAFNLAQFQKFSNHSKVWKSPPAGLAG